MPTTMSNTSSNTPKTDRPSLLARPSRIVFTVASLSIVAGFILMTGPATTAAAFCPDIFSVRRIVVAPTLCLAGYLLMAVAILLMERK